MGMPIRSVAAQKETGAIGVMKKAVAHDHVVAITLEVESLSVSTAQANGNESPFTVLEDPVLAPKKH